MADDTKSPEQTNGAEQAAPESAAQDMPDVPEIDARDLEIAQLKEEAAQFKDRLLRTAADRCLSRSIALALCLARHHCRANVILGVKLAPFAAHCWAQHGDAVLNDELEEVRRYQPILVL